MAKSQYNGDSPFPSPFSEHPGMSGSPETIPVKPAPFPALPAIEAPSMPAPYVLNGRRGHVHRREHRLLAPAAGSRRRRRDAAPERALPPPPPPSTSRIAKPEVGDAFSVARTVRLRIWLAKARYRCA